MKWRWKTARLPLPCGSAFLKAFPASTKLVAESCLFWSCMCSLAAWQNAFPAPAHQQRAHYVQRHARVMLHTLYYKHFWIRYWITLYWLLQLFIINLCTKWVTYQSSFSPSWTCWLLWRTSHKPPLICDFLWKNIVYNKSYNFICN